MIIDLDRFVAVERPYWVELEALLDRLRAETLAALDVEAARRLHYLYRRASSDLARLMTFAAEPELRRHLETLVARAYAEIHRERDRSARFSPLRWLMVTLPRTFRRHIAAFGVIVAVTVAGSGVGGGIVAMDPDARAVLIPFPQLLEHPSARVERERSVFLGDAEDRQSMREALDSSRASATGFYISHNTRVAMTTLALGILWGVGSLLVIFSNGLMLGVVCADYIIAGEGVFLAGWLLPHGATEIPAILLAGQGGLVLGGAMIGWGSREGLRRRLRRIAPDLVTIIGGAALLLVWSGIIEAWLSQYHFIIPTWAKILLGVVELAILAVFFGWAGRGARPDDPEARPA